MPGPRFIYHKNSLHYQFHEDHPFTPVRLKATKELLDQLGWLLPDEEVMPAKATTEELYLGHSPHYVDLVERLSEHGQKTFGIERLGLGTDDNPVFEGMHEAAALAVGGTLEAAKLIVNGAVKRAVNLSGGLHHAGSGHASGFCIYNDVVVAIRWIQHETNWKVLYIETDAHHGDGVQDAFYDDPNVFVLSLHESGQYLFPGTGHITETGQGEARGTTMNIPLAPATDDASWLQAFSYVVPAIIQQFHPDIIVSQHGCDGHYWDPLADMCATMTFYDEVPRLISGWVDEFTEGRWIATGGGGYQAVSVVPRAWSFLWAHMSSRPIPNPLALPSAWLETWQRKTPSVLPPILQDDPSQFPPIRDLGAIRHTNAQTLSRLPTLFPMWHFETMPDVVE